MATSIGAIAFVLAAIVLAYPAVAAMDGTSAQSPNNIKQLLQDTQHKSLHRANLVVGQTITLTSVAGGYREIGNPSVNGTATGSLTLKVTGVFTGGYALSVTGGSINFNGNTYTVSGGSGELGPYGAHMVGQGQAGSAQFLFSARDLGKFGTTSYGVLRVDLTNGSSEFGVRLLVTITA